MVRVLGLILDKQKWFDLSILANPTSDPKSKSKSKSKPKPKPKTGSEGDASDTIWARVLEQRRSHVLPALPGVEGLRAGPFMDRIWDLLPEQARPIGIPLGCTSGEMDRQISSVDNRATVAQIFEGLLLHPLQVLRVAKSHGTDIAGQEEQYRAAQVLQCCCLLDCALVGPLQDHDEHGTTDLMSSFADVFIERFWGSGLSHREHRRITQLVWLAESGLRPPSSMLVWAAAQSTVTTGLGLPIAVRLIECGHYTTAASLLEHDEDPESIPLYALSLMMSRSTDWEEAWHIIARRIRRFSPSVEHEISLRKIVTELSCAWVWDFGDGSDVEKLLTMPLQDVEERTLQDYVGRKADAALSSEAWRDVNILVSVYLHRGDVDGARQMHDAHVRHLMSSSPAAVNSESVKTRGALIKRYEMASS